jgi:hypothetical protein
LARSRAKVPILRRNMGNFRSVSFKGARQLSQTKRRKRAAPTKAKHLHLSVKLKKWVADLEETG